MIQSVGIAGSFLEEMHTFERFRSEFFMPSILFRQKRDKWDEQGQRRLDQVAEQVAAELISNEVDNGLTEEQSAALDDMARRFLQSVG